MSETINEKINRLNSDLEWFYGDEFSLDNAIEKYKAALSLSREIETDLEKMKNEIEIISKDFSLS